MGEKSLKSTGLGSRIRAIRQKMGLNQGDFALRLSVDQKTISRYETETNNPTVDFTNKLIEISGCNGVWLYFGRGEPFAESSTDNKESFKVSDQKAEYNQRGKSAAQPTSSPAIPAWKNPDLDIFDVVPFTESYLSAGGGAFVLSENFTEYYAFRKQWLSRCVTSKKNAVLMRVRGTSMEPKIEDGDVVLIDTGRKRIFDGRLYAIGLDDTIAIKRLRPLASGKIRIVSDNPDYENEDAHPDNLRIIGQIVWLGRAMSEDDF